jgi:anaerobic magnesium-protoporphyrin IX monomethyl ester cyclase
VKLVDRTFNYDADRADAIWEFILRNNRTSRFHFEIAADLLTEENLELLEKIPKGMFRFEIGVQSGSPGTLAEVGRKTNLDRLFANVEQLVARTGVIIHLDLIAGLPHENFSGFLASLQKLFDVRPHHIQVEPLKVLKGSPMEAIAAREGYAFADHPPYKILRTPNLPFSEISRIETISRLLDIFFNSGRFLTLLKAVAERETLSGFFHSPAIHVEGEEIPAGLSQRGSFELIWSFIKGHFSEEAAESLRDALCYDFCLCEYPVSGSLPGFLQSGEGVSSNISPGEIVKSLGIGRESKVRSFARRFLNDYTCTPWRKEETAILFVYVSAPGKGLQVKSIRLTGNVAG